MTHPTESSGRAAFALLAVLMLIGCSSGGRPPEQKPEFNPGEGAIAGKLVDSNDDPFDVSLAGEEGVKALEIELLSPSRGIAAATFPRKEKSTFVLSHVKPGRYELSVYTVVTGKRTIAGSSQVTVDREKVTSATLRLTVTPLKSEGQE
jgi:hypothetical protein